jgi:peptide/nickel transport system substrate-binding protein
MLPRTILEKAYREGALGTAWGPSVNPKQVVGMGPFRLREYQRGIKVVLERNPYYWKQDGSGQILPYLDTITFLIVPDRNAQALRFQSGEIDLVESLNAESYAGLRRYRSQGGFTLQDLGAGLGMDFLWFNLNPGLKASGEPIVEREKQALFENDAFRRAISCALDREGMARSVLLGLGEPQYGPVSSGNQAWFSSQVIRPCKGLQQSRSLLAQIGLKDANGDGLLEYGSRNRPLELALITSRGNAAREKVAQIISENLRNIGISVHVQTLLPGEIAARFMNSMDYEAILFGFTPTDVVPDLQADLWYSSGKLHFWHPGQSKPYRPWEVRMDELTSRLLQAPDPAERRKIFFEIQEIWALQMPAIPTVAPNVLSGWHNHMGNIRPSILVPNLLWNAEEITKRPPQQR